MVELLQVVLSYTLVLILPFNVFRILISTSA